MKLLWRRSALGAVLSLTAAAGGLLVAGTADAQTVATGSLKFSGPAGEYITQGESESFSTSNGDPLVVSSSSGSEVGVSVNISATEWWTLEIDAPGTSVLVPGTYTATRYPFNTTGAGLNLDGDGRGCNTLTGSFTVIDAVFGSNGYVQKFDATFVQHCEGVTAAASGEVHISNPPPPAGSAPTHAAATSPHVAATSGTSATGTGSGTSAGGGKSSGSGSGSAAGTGNASGSGTVTGSGNAFVGANAANTSAAPRNAPILLLAVGLVTWAVLVAVGLGIGLGLPIRRS